MPPMPSNNPSTPISAASTGNVSLPPRIEIFKAGTRVTEAGEPITFSAADLAAVAAGYQPQVREAPLVVGHPSTDGPAYGWVAKLQAEGDALYMDSKDVEPAFAEMVRNRRFPNRSVAFLRPDEPGNPTPGQWYLRHVGFLGAKAPALQGLKPITFSSGERVVVFAEEAISPTTVPTGTQDQELSMTEPEIAAMKAENERLQREARVKEQEAQTLQEQLVQFAEAQRNSQHAANVQFAEAQVQAGHVVPAERDRLVAVLDGLGQIKPVQFAEGGKTEELDLGAYVRGLVERAKPLVAFGEHAPGGAGAQAGAKGQRMTDEQATAHARSYATQHKVTFAEAYKASVVDAGVVVVNPA